MCCSYSIQGPVLLKAVGLDSEARTLSRATPAQLVYHMCTQALQLFLNKDVAENGTRTSGRTVLEAPDGGASVRGFFIKQHKDQ